MKNNTGLLAMILLSVMLTACGGNPLIQTAQDGTEVRFDDLRGSIEFAKPGIIGIAKAVKKAKDSGAMSHETAADLKVALQKSLDGVHEAEKLLALGDIDGATLKVKASRLLLEAVKTSLTRSGINFEEAQL